MADAKNVAAVAAGKDDEVLQWVTFRLDNETYGINEIGRAHV